MKATRSATMTAALQDISTSTTILHDGAITLRKPLRSLHELSGTAGKRFDHLARGEHAEKSAITINLCGFARGCSARLQWRIALVNSPLPQRWLELEYLYFKQALVELPGHPRSMQRGPSTFQPRSQAPRVNPRRATEWQSFGDRPYCF